MLHKIGQDNVLGLPEDKHSCQKYTNFSSWC